MFAPTSRYFTLPTATTTLPDGRAATYKRRRIVPQAVSLTRLAEVKVAQGERLDTITARVLGDPEQFWRVCDANGALDPGELALPGQTVHIPIPGQS